jgi:hypothetical protein
VLARSRRWPNDIGLGRELTRLVRLGTVVAEVVPNPRRPGEGGGRLIALGIVEGRPPVVHHRAKTGLISFAGVVEGSDACGGVVLTELVITCADCSIRSYLKEGGAAGPLADEAVQAQGKLTAPMEVMGGRAEDEDGRDFNGSEHVAILARATGIHQLSAASIR